MLEEHPTCESDYLEVKLFLDCNQRSNVTVNFRVPRVSLLRGVEALDLSKLLNVNFMFRSAQITGINDERLGLFCNHTRPPPLITPSSEAKVHFHSDSAGQDAGFQIHYSLIEGIYEARF